MGGFVPHAEKWAFISRRLNFRVGGENISKINSFRIIGQGRVLLLCPINSVKLLIVNNL
jgi:hypothetical protein